MIEELQTFEESKPCNLPSYAKHYAYINLHENWTPRICDHHKPSWHDIIYTLFELRLKIYTLHEDERSTYSKISIIISSKNKIFYIFF